MMGTIIAVGIGTAIGLVFAPLITILALNVVFGLSIPMNFGTWAAVLWLGFLIGGRSVSTVTK